MDVGGEVASLVGEDHVGWKVLERLDQVLYWCVLQPPEGGEECRGEFQV